MAMRIIGLSSEERFSPCPGHQLLAEAPRRGAAALRVVNLSIPWPPPMSLPTDNAPIRMEDYVDVDRVCMVSILVGFHSLAIRCASAI